MKFLDWLFGKGWDGPEDTVTDHPVEDEFKVDTKKFRPVPKWTHPGKKGKTIYCPECGGPAHVYNFSWSSLRCVHCEADVGKYQWLLPITRKRRKKNG